MDTIIIETTPQQKQSLLSFLSRVQLNAQEIPAYLEIMQAVNAIEKIETTPTKTKSIIVSQQGAIKCPRNTRLS